MEWISDPAIWLSLATLTVMEIILGIDNIVFISVITSRLPPELAKRARQIGLALALVFRIIFLLLLSWIIGLTETVFSLGLTGPIGEDGHPSFETDFSWRDIILGAGGLFLLYKATTEIHKGVEGEEEHALISGPQRAFGAVIAQIIVIDLVFSIDSIITAVGMAEVVGVMIAAVVIAMIVMYLASGAIAAFIHRNPTTKMLALAFLFMIGAALVADALGFHIPRAYLYTAMAFSAIVEVLNVRARRNRERAKAELPPPS
ncbi:MAG: TerC family protein [Bauldia sp.]|nr:TerC family protein [Bauldia sp.]